MIKVVTVCGAGVGSSMMLRLFSQQILDAENIEATVDASDIGSVAPNDYDIVVTTSSFAENVRSNKDNIVKIDNLMDKVTLREELLKKIYEIQSKE